MSIPLDKLYHYIESVANSVCDDNVVIYHFYPHGSKNLADCHQLNNYGFVATLSNPHVYCYDQEPLNFDLYEEDFVPDEITATMRRYSITLKNNLRTIDNVYNSSILLHSEQRSLEVDKYSNNLFVPAYYWSHAVIALDWFRYAQHVNVTKKPGKKFLIYNRAWTGTREYRLKFSDLLVDHDLVNDCQTSVGLTDQNIYYKDHKFINPNWQPSNHLEDSFKDNTTPSTYSADIVFEDYANTNIEVVLETLFDDARLHLTEKSLRPVACGQPFILAGTHGSLEYLKQYGFKTFGNIWNEDYDSIKDASARLEAIVQLMKEIAGWSDATRVVKLNEANDIAEFNRNHFFSKEFFNQVRGELKDNLNRALVQLEQTNTAKLFIDTRKQIYKVPELANSVTMASPHRTRQQLAQVIRKARQYYLRCSAP